MSGDFKQFEQRKQAHIELALLAENQATAASRLDQVSLWHDALPDFDFDEIELSTKRFAQAVPKPFMISSMTAGHEAAETINAHLMAAASQQGWAMGVGSQRRELTDRHEAEVWLRLCQRFPEVDLFGNLGIAQLITTPLDEVKRLATTIHAKAMIIHCNPLQEAIQPEGTPAFKGCWTALERVVEGLSIPIIVKETGCGFSPKTLQRLNDMGVHAVDVSGLGGTHWGRIEGHRAKAQSKERRAAEIFGSWGVDTVQSIRLAYALNPTYEIWGSGGVRHGLDAAKLLALGASTIGIAKPMMVAALLCAEAVVAAMVEMEYELKLALFCTGSRTLSELQGKICPPSI